MQNQPEPTAEATNIAAENVTDPIQSTSTLGGKGQVKMNLPEPLVDSTVVITLDHHSRKITPKEGQRNILITSALPYVNNIPHLGNLIGSVLSADVFARYSRLRSANVLFICGTDEYGTATETKAIEEKMSCKQLCDKYFKFHDETYKWFQIDFDHFGRTTTDEQTVITQDIFLSLEKNGHVMEDTITQLYCTQHSSFLADRFVEGTCPLCGYGDARGDQCDGCGKLLNAIELVNPRCKLDGATPIARDSKHLFLNLTDQQEKLEKWFLQASTEGMWSANSQTITNSWLKEGLKPRCITRDLKWGTPVPREGYENKVFYVWFDAPIGYLSITATYTNDWEKWWKNPKDVKLYQFMGKDNVPFHTVIFPSTLQGTDQDWTLLHHLSTTEYLQYESGKFSKSRGVGVFGNNVVDSGIPVEVWRYYLLSIRPESGDSYFSWNAFITANNTELLANLGNYVNRLVKFINAKYDGVIPTYQTSDEPEKKLTADVAVLLRQYIDALDGVKIRQGLRLFMDISARGNLYLQENRIDNSLFANSRERCNNVVAVAANLAYLLSALVYPYLPSTSEGIRRQLNLPMRRISDTWDGTDIVAGHKIGAAEYLFKKLDESLEKELRIKYSGKQDPAADTGANATGSQSGKKRSNKKSTSTTLPSSVPASDVVKTPEMTALEDQIAQQAGTVRSLKADKAAPSDVKTAVDELLALKSQLAALYIA
ncbi:hypothetical protein BASA50_006780 [Batrachochytrium salamandrivorans]|uniref:methionine--tRNA ligase n=1 Tax=Batrachochytrium salamandrivorans TaxID=1357716 RepID=A0ABQ8FAB5_9FUNG|nr:hypothetical protein BASA62_001416 [Batrachochytrium salamandrivorans]KAH6580174.1 hypothetical protein BASA60_002991 [Batrachochytrium salamandrivorans]KAH6590536.1 hypothetical protein BASA61_005295 [Batrachochytrium salamandrivorans]KAH6594309.1 hypothetical protein BASA50_006780 [Batrachochytrium salamandrivorans]KAH9270010.1 methionine-tRNA ligase [Batrachochytrium salamandrivorans]